MKPIHALAAAMALLLIGVFSAAALAADEPSKGDADAKAKSKASKQEAANKGKNRPQKNRAKRRSAVPDTFPADIGMGGMSGMNIDEGRAVKRIGGHIREALSLRPTLVVWLVETSPAAELLRRTSIDSIVQLMQELADEHPGKLEMAALGYAADARWATSAPTAKASELQSALAGLSTDKSDKVNVCGAVRQALEKYLPRRMSGGEVIFVIVGASSGDDLNEADAVLLSLKRAAIPVFAFGPPSRFGLTAAQTVRRRMERDPLDEDPPIESLYAERIRLALPGQQGTADLTDAGFGPFGLERLSRQSGGKFLRLRDVSMTGWEIDGATGGIKPELLERYAPDYVDEQQYRRLLAENKCRMALHQASQLPALVTLEAPKLDFRPTANEAQLATEITRAQQQAAIKDQPLQQLYDALIAGESDRAKLTGARWQAGYDLAMGQVLAAKARLDGYNAMLATLKQGKKFTNPDSKVWVLEPADEIAAASALDKMAKNSRVYLKRVAEDHKGTPWATIAERELQHPAGWKFVEK